MIPKVNPRFNNRINPIMKRKRSQRIESRLSSSKKRKGSIRFQEMINESEQLLSRSRSRSMHLTNKRKSSNVKAQVIQTEPNSQGLLYLILSSLDDNNKMNSHQIYKCVKDKLPSDRSSLGIICYSRRIPK